MTDWNTLAARANTAITAAFGEAVIVTVGATQYPLRGVFSEPLHNVTVAGVGVLQAEPEVEIAEADAPPGDLSTATVFVVAQSRTFRVSRKPRRQFGQIKMELREVFN